MSDQPTEGYRRPGWAERKLLLPLVTRLIGRLGVGPSGAGVLEVRDRETGDWRSNPVHVLDLDGDRFLVAARGETGWAQNLRAAGGGRLKRRGRSTEFTAVELADADKLPVLRAYLRKTWRMTGDMFAVDSPDAGDDELASIVPNHPIFRLNT